MHYHYDRFNGSAIYTEEVIVMEYPHPLFQMNFYWWKKNGKIVVQNMVGGMMGQKHEHTLAGFKKWKKGIPKEYLHNVGRKGKSQTTKG